MDEQRQDNQLEPIYNSSVPIQDITLKTWEQWIIETGSERGSGRSMLAANHVDDYIYIYACICTHTHTHNLS